MRMDSMKTNFDTAVDVQKRYNAAKFMIGLIEHEVREILSRPSFVKLPEDVKSSLVVSRARAIRFWNIQLDDFLEKNLSAWINAAARVKESKQLDITLRQAIELYGPVDRIPEIIAASEKEIVPDPVELSETMSDSDILAGLMENES